MKALASAADITGPVEPVMADNVAGRFAWGVCPVLVNAREALVGVSGSAVAAAPPLGPPPILPNMVRGKAKTQRI